MNTTEREEFDKMPTNELVAYWNILQMSKKCLRVGDDGRQARHEIIVDEILTKRNIPHEMNKLINKVSK